MHRRRRLRERLLLRDRQLSSGGGLRSPLVTTARLRAPEQQESVRCWGYDFYGQLEDDRLTRTPASTRAPPRSRRRCQDRRRYARPAMGSPARCSRPARSTAGATGTTATSGTGSFPTTHSGGIATAGKVHLEQRGYLPGGGELQRGLRDQRWQHLVLGAQAPKASSATACSSRLYPFRQLAAGPGDAVVLQLIEHCHGGLPPLLRR